MTPFMLGSYPPGWDPSSPAPGGPCLPNAAGYGSASHWQIQSNARIWATHCAACTGCCATTRPAHGRIVTPKEDIADGARPAHFSTVGTELPHCEGAGIFSIHSGN